MNSKHFTIRSGSGAGKGPHSRRANDTDAPDGSRENGNRDGHGSNNGGGGGRHSKGKRKGDHLRRLLDTLSGRHMRPAKRRLLGTLVSILLIALLFCLLALLQAVTNPEDLFGEPWRESRPTALPTAAAPAAPKTAREEFFMNEADDQRLWLGGAPPEKGGNVVREQGEVGNEPAHAQDGLRPTYLDLRHRSHPFFTVAQLTAMATAGAEADIAAVEGHAQGLTLVFNRTELNDADRSLEDALHYLLPPQQRAAAMRDELDSFLSIGPRPVREPAFERNRQAAMRFIVDAGLGTKRFTPSRLAASGKGGEDMAVETQAAAYRDAPHLSAKGKQLLLSRVHTPASAADMRASAAVNLQRPDDNEKAASAAAGKGETEDAVVNGWWWTLAWDNFTQEAPRMHTDYLSPAAFTNMVFHFAGGSRFRAKAAKAALSSLSSSAAEADETKQYPVRSRPLEMRSFFNGESPAYEQDSFIKLLGDDEKTARAQAKGNTYASISHPLVERIPATVRERTPTATYRNGKTHGQKEVKLTRSGRSVPLKANLGGSLAAPVTHQPLTHVAFSAHWDTIPEAAVARDASTSPPLTATGKAHSKGEKQSFLGACDSAVPVVFLLRKMKNIAVLSDVAEAVASLYLEEYRQQHNGETGLPADAKIPGVSSAFRDASAADVEEHLRQVISPVHYALLYKYYFAKKEKTRGSPDGGTNGFTDARRRSGVLPYHLSRDEKSHGMSTHNLTSFAVVEDKVVDPRALLDWVQHLPSITAFFFDGEEALKEWEGNDNTYGSRHLARRWSHTPARPITPAPFTRDDAATSPASPKTYERAATGRKELMLMEDLDLFLLYDLLGPPGTALQNFFPSQSGIFYTELARIERIKRSRAFAHGNRLTKDFVDATIVMAEGQDGAADAQTLSRILRYPNSKTAAEEPHDGEGMGTNGDLRLQLLTYLAQRVQLSSVRSILGPFKVRAESSPSAKAPLTLLEANAPYFDVDELAARDSEFGPEVYMTLPPSPPDDDTPNTKRDGALASKPLGTQGAMLPFAIYRHDFYRPMPRAWQLYGSPHEMFTLHAVPRINMDSVVHTLNRNPQLRFYENYKPHTFSPSENTPRMMREMAVSLWNGTFEEVFGKESGYYDILFNTNQNIFFSKSQTPLRTRYAFVVAVDDDHKHWLDSQRVLHLIPTPFPPAWHTPFDNGESIDDGTMTDLWSVLWDFTLLLGEYWESQ